jgi:hypothetical protein
MRPALEKFIKFITFTAFAIFATFAMFAIFEPFNQMLGKVTRDRCHSECTRNLVVGRRGAQNELLRLPAQCCDSL